MRQYTLAVFARRAVSIPDPLIMLGPGPNVFSVFTDDIEAVKALLVEEGATINEVNAFEAEPVSQLDLLLPGEDPADVLAFLPSR